MTNKDIIDTVNEENRKALMRRKPEHCPHLAKGTQNNCTALGLMFGYSCSEARKEGRCKVGGVN
jgi:hypothetical protein